MNVRPCGPRDEPGNPGGLHCGPLSVLLTGPLSRGLEVVHRVALGRCPAWTAGSNCAELHNTRAGKGMFGEVCIIFMTLNLHVC